MRGFLLALVLVLVPACQSTPEQVMAQAADIIEAPTGSADASSTIGRDAADLVGTGITLSTGNPVLGGAVAAALAGLLTVLASSLRSNSKKKK